MGWGLQPLFTRSSLLAASPGRDTSLSCRNRRRLGNRCFLSLQPSQCSGQSRRQSDGPAKLFDIESVDQRGTIDIDETLGLAPHDDRSAQNASLTNLFDTSAGLKIFVVEGIADNNGSISAADPANDGTTDFFGSNNEGRLVPITSSHRESAMLLIEHQNAISGREALPAVLQRLLKKPLGTPGKKSYQILPYGRDIVVGFAPGMLQLARVSQYVFRREISLCARQTQTPTNLPRINYFGEFVR